MGHSGRTERMTNTTPGFYQRLGPFLARREIARELGSPIWDDDDLTWLVVAERGDVLGFCALRERRDATELRSVYVTPMNRNRGVFATLVSAAGRPLRATVPNASVDAYLSLGFRPYRALKHYQRLELP